MTENPEMHEFETGKLKLKITLAADRNAVDPVVQSVMELVRQVHCDPEKYDAIELALTEALANAVVQGPRPIRRRLSNATWCVTKTRAY